MAPVTELPKASTCGWRARVGPPLIWALAGAYVAACVAAGLTVADRLTVSVPLEAEAKAPPTTDVAVRLPLAFVPNAGQADPRVHYSAFGPGYAFRLTSRAIELSFSKNESSAGRPIGALPPTRRARRESVTALALEFVGADPDAVPQGIVRAPGAFNYFIGSDPARWRTAVAAYEQVAYHGLWPGVDMVVHGQAGRLAYDFVVAPHARVDQIRLAYGGARATGLDSTGDLIIETAVGPLTDRRPVTHQVIDGEVRPVSSRYELFGGDGAPATFGFSVGGEYEPDYPLVIDPGLVYATYLGGTLNDAATSVAADGAGNAYVAGFTQSLDFPTTPGAYDTTSNGDALEYDGFVTKLNAAGSGLVYSTYLGGALDDAVRDVVVDAAGNAYLVGNTESPDFPTTPGAYDRSLGRPEDGFVVKLDARGALVYSTLVGGRGSDFAESAAVDAAGNAYVTGGTGSTDFPTTAGAYDTSANGRIDAFVLKLNAAGAGLLYSTYLGGSDSEAGGSVAVDARGNAYVASTTYSADFPITPGAYNRKLKGDTDAFLAKLNARGSALSYSTFLGGTDFESRVQVAVDGGGHAYVAGATRSRNFPHTAGAFDSTGDRHNEGFLTKVNATGSGLLYSTFIGGTGEDEVLGMTVDGRGNAFLTGFTSSPDFPLTPDAADSTLNDGDAFVAEVDAAGSDLVYSTFLGGSGLDVPLGIALDARGKVYVVGYTDSPDFPVTPGAYDSSSGRTDAFVVKMTFPVASPCAGATLRGTEGDDVLVGTAGPDVIDALAGDDAVDGLGGDDVICGGPGNDRLLGGGGRDHLYGGSGNDALDGENGADFLSGDGGDDVLNGGTGRDEIWGGSGDDALDGGSGGAPGAPEDDLCDGGSHVVGDTAVRCETVRRVP